jgi:hypothetical protein
MNWLSLLELGMRALPAVAQGIVAVLHFSGADRHKTVAGQIADGLQKAGDAAAVAHQLLMNGVQVAPAAQVPAR